MEESSPLKSFMALANFDQTLNQTQFTINQLYTESLELQRKLSDVESQFELSKQHVRAAQKLVHEYELNMKELDTNLQRQKKLLETVANQKEYVATKNSINQIRQQQHESEPMLIDAWNALENAKELYDRREQNFAEQVSTLQEQILQNKQASDKLQQKLAELMQERQKFMKGLPAEWLDKYEAMYTKVTNPIVQLLDNACSACFHQATPQFIINLKHRQLIQCQGCHRFLFFAKEEPKG